MAKLDVDNHLMIVGNFGRYQWLQLLLTGMMVACFGMQMFVSIFTHGTPDYKCQYAESLNNSKESNSTESIAADACSVQVDGEWCTEFEYDKSMFMSTIVTDFDLVCDRNHYVTVANMAWMASEGVGALLGSYISDRYGRKPLVIATYLTIGVFGSVTASSVNLTMYIIIRCVMGFVCFAGFSAAAALLMESVSPHKRSQALNAIDLFWVLGYSSLSLWGFLIREWRYLQLAISIIGVPLGIICFWLLDESPHWLSINGQEQKLLELLNKMARWNGVDMPNAIRGDSPGEESKLDFKTQEAAGGPRENCCDIWRHRRVVVRLVVYSLGWVACTFCYYALSFGVTNLPGNLYLNNFIMSGVEGLAYACCFVIAYTGRKVPTVGSYLAGGCSLLISIIIQLYAPETLARARAITALSVVGKFCISAAWQIIFVWQSEVYPTTHRCMLTSLNGVVGRIGTVLAPYMVDLHKYINVPNEDIILPSLFVVLMVGVGLMHIIPPETNKRKLPVNLHEANKSSFPFAGEQDELRSTFKEDGLLQTTKI